MMYIADKLETKAESIMICAPKGEKEATLAIDIGAVKNINVCCEIYRGSKIEDPNKKFNWRKREASIARFKFCDKHLALSFLARAFQEY